MDIPGLLPVTGMENKYILIVGDFYTKWKEACPMRDMESTPPACQFGLPDTLHTDQGRNFESTLIKEICSLVGVNKTHTTPIPPAVRWPYRKIYNKLCVVEYVQFDRLGGPT